jgi:hypothetical protein
MPAALLRPCAELGCPALVPSGPWSSKRCPDHQRAQEQRRGSASSRGYTSAWSAFRRRFIGLLVSAGIAPVCGASLPGGPDLTSVSVCRRAGVLNDQKLHLHHEPPLTDAERQDARAVLDKHRVGFLCERCHNAETARTNGLAIPKAGTGRV